MPNDEIKMFLRQGKALGDHFLLLKKQCVYKDCLRCPLYHGIVGFREIEEFSHIDLRLCHILSALAKLPVV